MRPSLRGRALANPRKPSRVRNSRGFSRGCPTTARSWTSATLTRPSRRRRFAACSRGSALGARRMLGPASQRLSPEPEKQKPVDVECGKEQGKGDKLPHEDGHPVAGAADQEVVRDQVDGRIVHAEAKDDRPRREVAYVACHLLGAERVLAHLVVDPRREPEKAPAGKGCGHGGPGDDGRIAREVVDDRGRAVRKQQRAALSNEDLPVEV